MKYDLSNVEDLKAIWRRANDVAARHGASLDAEGTGPLDLFFVVISELSAEQDVIRRAVEILAGKHIERLTRERDAAQEQLKAIGRKAFWASKVNT